MRPGHNTLYTGFSILFPDPIYVMIYDCAKFERGKWEQHLPQLHMLSTGNGGLPLLALPFFRVVYGDTDADPL